MRPDAVVKLSAARSRSTTTQSIMVFSVYHLLSSLNYCFTKILCQFTLVHIYFGSCLFYYSKCLDNIGWLFFPSYWEIH